MRGGHALRRERPYGIRVPWHSLAYWHSCAPVTLRLNTLSLPHKRQPPSKKPFRSNTERAKAGRLRNRVTTGFEASGGRSTTILNSTHWNSRFRFQTRAFKLPKPISVQHVPLSYLRGLPCFLLFPHRPRTQTHVFLRLPEEHAWSVGIRVRRPQRPRALLEPRQAPPARPRQAPAPPARPRRDLVRAALAQVSEEPPPPA